MPMTTVVTIIAMVVIVARGGSSMVAVVIAHRMPIIAAIVGHALVTCWAAVVLASGNVGSRTAVGMAATCSGRTATAAIPMFARATCTATTCVATTTALFGDESEQAVIGDLCG